MTVDEILAADEYRDRRGRKWQKLIGPLGWVNMSEHRMLTRSQMRLLIERDQHRDECPGLINCENHPVPCVTLAGGPYGCFHVNPAGDSEETYVAHECSHEWAMDAARALAVGE